MEWGGRMGKGDGDKVNDYWGPSYLHQNPKSWRKVFGCDLSLSALFLFGPPLYVPGRTPQRHPGAAGDAAALGQQPAKPFLSCLVGVGNQEVDVIPWMSAIEVSGVCVYFHTSMLSHYLGWRDVNEWVEVKRQWLIFELYCLESRREVLILVSENIVFTCPLESKLEAGSKTQKWVYYWVYWLFHHIGF